MNWIVGTLACVTAACSVETPTVDPATVPQNGYPGVPVGTPVGPGGVPIGYPPPGGACRFDTRQVVESQGHHIEVVTSRGRLFEFENGNPVKPATATATIMPTPYPTVGGPNAFGAADLSSIPLYAAGPCAGRAPGSCLFETQAFVLLPEGRFLEYVTSLGRQWVFEHGQMTGAGVDLGAIPRYAEVCANRGLSGGLCRFDTRTFVKDGPDVVESITAYGRLWELDLDGQPFDTSGADLTQMPQYLNGPCRGRAPGTCAFETRTFEVLNGQLVETITAGGLVFRYLTNGAELQGNGLPVGATPYWANGPCR